MYTLYHAVSYIYTLYAMVIYMTDTRAKQYMKMVRLDDDVHAELTELGTKNESYSDVIRRLIKFYRGSKK
jgi:hypothetical protein